MAASEEDLKSRLTEVGRRLGKTPTSVKELLSLLDRVEVYLSCVPQSPSKGIQNVLGPTLKALISGELLRHVDVDVKVAVASCLTEITRITAPEVPYDDDQMKEAFQLIVSSFERLDDKSSPSYRRRISILETFARVRLCVVMLDLEFDGLILEMFCHFINAIRDYHDENVFAYMANIMIHVVEESEVISSDLLFCILEAVRKDNKEVMPVACKLMTEVIGTCADKLRPYIKMAVMEKVVSLAHYGDVVNNLHIQSQDSCASAVDTTAEETPVSVVNSTGKFSTDCTNLATSNGDTGIKGDTHTLQDPTSLQCPKMSIADKDSETADPSSAARDLDGPEGIKRDLKAALTVDENPSTTDGNLVAKKEERNSTTEPVTEAIIKKQGRKTKAKNFKKTTSEPKLDGNSISVVQQPDVFAESHKCSNTEICSSPRQKSSNEAAEHVSLKPLDNNGVPSMRLSGDTKESADIFNECPQSQTAFRSSENLTSLDNKMTASVICPLQEGTTNPSVDASLVESNVSNVDVCVEETYAPDAGNLVGTSVLSTDAVQDATARIMDAPVMEVRSGVRKSTEHSGSQTKHTYEVEHDTPKTKDSNKTRGKSLSKATLQKHAVSAENNNKESTTTQKSAVQSVKDGNDLKGSPKTTTKRRRIEEHKNENKDFGQELVGSKVKIWWPDDKRYYDGVIKSFNSAQKKHKVLYSDGEVENLVLKNERWKVISPDEVEHGPPKAKDDVITRGRDLGKAALQKHASATENITKESTSTPKSAMKSVQYVKILKGSPTATKRKRTEENINENKDFGEELVGLKVKIWWPNDQRYYKGVIKTYNSSKKKHKVLYSDGDVENLVLKNERWVISNVDEESDTEEESEHEMPDDASGKSKCNKGKDMSGGTSRKRLERSLSSETRSVSNKPNSKLRDDFEGAKAKTRSKTERVKSAGKSRSDVGLSSMNSRKSEVGGSRTGSKRRSDFENASSQKIKTRNVTKKDFGGELTSLGDRNPTMKSVAKSKRKELSKSKSGSARSSKIVGKSLNISPKSNVNLKAHAVVDSDLSNPEDTKESALEKTQSQGRETRSSKRKAFVLGKESKDGLNSAQKRKKGR